MTTPRNSLIEMVWTHMTDEGSATHIQAELAVEAVKLWLRKQGQTEAAELLTNQQTIQPHTHKPQMSNFYTNLSGTDVVRSKIDVFTLHDEAENQTHRVELTVDNDGVFITSCEGGAREDMSIAQKDLAIAVARGILEAYGEV